MSPRILQPDYRRRFKGIVSQTVEGHRSADQPPDLEPDDEEYLFVENCGRQFVVEYHQDRLPVHGQL